MDSNIVKKGARLTVFALVMITVGSVDSIRNLPATALFGSSLIFFFYRLGRSFYYYIGPAIEQKIKQLELRHLQLLLLLLKKKINREYIPKHLWPLWAEIPDIIKTVVLDSL